MLLTIENENQSKMSFLDVQIILQNEILTTYVNRKHIFSGANTYFDSFLASNYKFGTVYTLAYRCFQMTALKVEDLITHRIT